LWSELTSEKAITVLNHLTKKSCSEEKSKAFFDSLIKDKKVIRNAKPLNERILKDLESWRFEIGKALYEGGLKDLDRLNNTVQSLIDRIILIRSLQDRHIDSSDFTNLKKVANAKKIGRLLVDEIFPHFEQTISSEFFTLSQNEKNNIRDI